MEKDFLPLLYVYTYFIILKPVYLSSLNIFFHKNVYTYTFISFFLLFKEICNKILYFIRKRINF